MSTLFRFLRILLILIVIVGLLVSGGAYILVQRMLPQTSGRVVVAGLTNAVEIIRDFWGVPHIYAQNMDDLFFAQGYVMAQDRLWQMEFNRRVAAGRLSEFAGGGTLKDDILLRSLGLYRMAQATAQRLSPQTLSVLDAYARGVNFFVATHRDRLPLEFTILNSIGGANIGWEPWTPTDTLAIGNVMALGLSMNMRIELFRSQMWARLGKERAADLEPGYPQDGPFIVKSMQVGANTNGENHDTNQAGAVATDGLAELATALDRVTRIALSGGSPVDNGELPISSLGSNNWVVAGTKTTTGKPFLANDPHLGIQNPSIWYEVHLEAPGLRIAGVTFAGVPGIVLGHNDRIAWGATNAEVDVQDLYIEKINPANPTQYEYKGRWEDGQIWHEEIRVKGQSRPVVRDILVTRHGPIITEAVKDRITETVALQWSLYRGGTLFEAVARLWTARDWNDFQAAMKLWDVPSQNIVYADVDGNIGYKMPGLLPIRAKGQGAAPVPGWTGEYEWIGWIPFEDLPGVFNPATSFVATANNRPVDYSYKYYLSNEWAPPYRAQRIEDLLTAKPTLSIQDMRAIQADVYCLPDHELAKYIMGLEPENERQRQAIDLIRAWDGRTSTDSVAASLVETTLSYIMRYTFGDELGPLASDYLDNGVPVLLRILPDNDNLWFDDVATPQRETRNDILRRSFTSTLADLSKRLGSDMNTWTWGRLHTATFKHQAFGDIPLLNRIFNLGPVPLGGSGGNGFTVYAATYRLAKPYAVGTISSMRAIYDLANLDNSLMVNAVGQSGQPGSKYYGDMIIPWRDVQHLPMPFSRSAVEQHADAVLTLLPG